MLQRLLPTLIGIFFTFQLHAQSSAIRKEDSTLQLPTSYLDKVSSKANQLQQKIDDKTDKVLFQMMKQEEKMRKKLAKSDPAKAIEIFGEPEQRYSALKERLKNKLPGRQYIASLDTLSTSLKFLQQNPQLVSQVKDGEQKIKDAMGKVNGLDEKFQQAEELKKFLKERKQFLNEQLSKLGFVKELKKLNKQVYYYSEQLNEYKAMLKDQKKIERKAIELLSKTKFFKDFMKKNSMIASLFPVPGNPDDPSFAPGLSGLQTRTQVNALIQQQIASGGPNAQVQFQQNIQEAQNQMNQLKNKINQLGGLSSSAEMPDGFKPNSQKTKSFLKRFEFGTNIQTQKASYYFPVTSDIGLSAGYKLNDKSIIGIGVSYKLGMGRGWNHIRLTNQGLGLRSFIDRKLKGNFYVTGGYEQNYKTEFNSTDQLQNLSDWQQSGLLGLTKTLSVKSKLVKKTKMMVLWDFLSYKQVPRTQPIIFRVGYNF